MNRLQFETSPYLLQHAHNPVDWYAWKPEAFERAKADNKPIIVSIGYSTCHWCHVMERESFENPDVAAVMNEFFVNIKVDREERPDVDAIYMEACQIMNGNGGWPLNCFLTPEGQPFYAGTYYPPQPAYGRPSWVQVLHHFARIWREQQQEVYEQAQKLMVYIRKNDNAVLELGPLANSGLAIEQPDAFRLSEMRNQAFYALRERFDRAEGGFGGAPKFPSAMSLHYLLHYHAITGNAEALEHVVLSLDAMIYGGIYDQLGGGFARYSTDREWLVPHFEKMLYDNALLVSLMADAYKITGHSRYREAVEETLEFVFREMTHAGGGFFSALDADSEGEEGKFYVWTLDELNQLLPPEEAALFAACYDVTSKGNWEHHNILRQLGSYAHLAQQQGLTEENLKARLAASKAVLFQARAERIRPGLDDKILVSWNALMASACAAAYSALGQENFFTAAIDNVEFLLNNLAGNETSPLAHTWKDGVAQYDAFLDDYANLIAALIDIWEITFDFRYLSAAEKYTEHVLSYFSDPESMLFYFTGAQQSDVLIRKRDLYDNATPSGNSTMALNLQRLALLLGRPDMANRASAMLEQMQHAAGRFPDSFPRWALANLRALTPSIEFALVGPDAKKNALAIQKHFFPYRVLAASASPSDEIPLLAGKTAEDNTYIYVCRNYACLRPVTSIEEAIASAKE